jgi:DNA damage-binding protein 1
VTLTEISHFSSLFIAQHLHVAPSTKLHGEERLVVGDGMRSVFVLDVDEENGVIHGDQRDMGTHQILGMEGIRDGGEGVIVADVST